MTAWSSSCSKLLSFEPKLKLLSPCCELGAHAGIGTVPPLGLGRIIIEMPIYFSEGRGRTAVGNRRESQRTSYWQEMARGY